MLYQLSSKTVTNFVNAYFGKSGIENNIIRVPIAGTDFSNRTYKDYPNDLNLTKFSLAYEDLNLKIPFVIAAMRTSQRPLKLFASAWSAPPWMKTNND
jgi:glucosylceramidase